MWPHGAKKLFHSLCCCQEPHSSRNRGTPALSCWDGSRSDTPPAAPGAVTCDCTSVGHQYFRQQPFTDWWSPLLQDLSTRRVKIESLQPQRPMVPLRTDRWLQRAATDQPVTILTFSQREHGPVSWGCWEVSSLWPCASTLPVSRVREALILLELPGTPLKTWWCSQSCWAPAAVQELHLLLLEQRSGLDAGSWHGYQGVGASEGRRLQ